MSDAATQARELLARADERPSAEWLIQTGEEKTDVLAAAQIHATLALIEQQRIANRLKVAELDLVEEIGAHDVDGGLNFRIRPYLTAGDWASIEVPEDDEVWR